MRIPQFAMERMQSTWENLVDYNLSESGVHPMRVEELLLEDPADRAGAAGPGTVYPQSNGTIALRERVAAMYPGATADHVEVTNGGSEANFVTMWHLVEPGDEVISHGPELRPDAGPGRGVRRRAVPWPLRLSSRRQALDVDLDRPAPARDAADPPHHHLQPEQPDRGAHRRGIRPRRHLRDRGHRRRVAAVGRDLPRRRARRRRDARRCGAATRRVIITSGLSKAYGLPGLRIGWIVSSPELVATTWSYHDYTTIGPGALSDLLARTALEPAIRARILARTRRHPAREPAGHRRLARRPRRPLLATRLPDAGAIVYVRYHDAINSTELVERLRVEKSVLIVPGDHFGMDGYLRIGFGSEMRYLRDGLDRLADLLRVAAGRGRAH